MVNYFINNWNELFMLFVQHFLLSAGAILFSLCIAIPISYLLYKHEIYTSYVLTLYGFIYVIPSIALFAFLIPFLGLGWVPVFVSLVLYSQVSLTRSILTAFKHVSHHYLEIGEALGLTRKEQFWRVEFPLAIPIIIGGVRVTTLNIIGIATLGALMNAGGLGVLIFEGLSQNNPLKIVMGTITIMLLSLVIHLGFKRIEEKVGYEA